MLAGKEMVATIAAKDLATARKFYEGTLGLKVEDDTGTEAHTYRSAGTRLIVYRSQFAGTNKATAATWAVGDDIEQVVGDLKNKGEKFEHYDFPGTTLQGDVHVMGKTKAAWLKDPDGNILSLVNGES